jgi:hypothetical protein
LIWVIAAIQLTFIGFQAMPITALFDISAVILYFNGALSSDVLAMMEQAMSKARGPYRW